MWMLSSMTGFGRSEGVDHAGSWVWEIRSVNARGLELRWRLPAGLDGMEPALRDAAAKVLRRGSVQGNLAFRSSAAVVPVVNEVVLEQVLQVVARVATRVPGALPPRIEQVLALPGVMSGVRAGDAEVFSEAQMAVVRAGFELALEKLVEARRAEGLRLGEVVQGLLQQVAALRGRAAAAAALQPGLQRERMLASVQALLEALPALPEERIAQEVALLAGRSDVREELDRLGSHVEAAVGLLAEGKAVGRQLDFLVQEFLRETNTICSKSATRELTAIGLQLKGVVEQIREQVQNLE
jgi:uncharacterized protein (TIGR00255 family)